MRKILEEAKFYADHYLPDLPDEGMTHFLAPFRTIESELQKLSELVAKTLGEQDVRIDEATKERDEKIDKVQNQYELIIEMLEVKKIALPDEPLGVAPWGFEVAQLNQKIAELAATVGTKLREQDITIGGLKKDIFDAYEMLAQRTKRIKALEEEFMDHLANEHNIEIRKSKRVDVPTDKDGKPPGGLEPGDVLEYHSPRYQKRVGAIFTGQTSEQRCSGWIEACRVCDGEVVVIDIELDECKFKFRPRFPDRKER